MRTYCAVDDELDNRPFDEADMREIEAQAQRRGITVDQFIEEEGVVRGPDGGLEWRDPEPGETAGMRYAYDERTFTVPRALAYYKEDAEAWGPRGPSASYAEWVAEGCDLGEDVRPSEKLWDVPGDQERGQ